MFRRRIPHNTRLNCAASIVHSLSRVPVALREPLKEELDTLIQQGIIAKVDRPTDWVNLCVCVTKPNGTLRLCLDTKDLNKAIKRPHHYTPTLDDVLPKLKGHTFSVSSTPEVDTGTLSWTKKVPTTQQSTHLTDDIDSRGCHSDWIAPKTYSKRRLTKRSAILPGLPAYRMTSSL